MAVEIINLYEIPRYVNISSELNSRFPFLFMLKIYDPLAHY